MNLFISNINNYSDSGMFEFDKTNVKYRSYLGLHLISYFSGGLGQRKYVYDEDHHQFVFGDYRQYQNLDDTQGKTGLRWWLCNLATRLDPSVL